MAHRSQCSSAGDNPLDPNYLPPHYREEYRLAIDALVEDDLEGYYRFLQGENVVDFLSTPEIEYIQSTVQVPQKNNHPEQRYLESMGDGSSDTYWPIHSDLDAPGLDLGWPQLHRFIGPTEVTTLVNPAEPDMPTIKEQARRLIKNAQQVVAIVMDMFTDVDIFADILNAAMRNVAVYVLLDEQNAHHFINMASNCRVNLESIQFMRVRTVSGITYHCRSGKSFKGQMMDRFLLTDCRAVLSGNYSFMWSFEKIHRCLAHLFLGQLVSTFDEEFRILFAQSQPLMIENVLPPVEDFSHLPGRQHTSERTPLYREPRKFLPIDISRPDEWARHSFDERMDMDRKKMPLHRQEAMHRSLDQSSVDMHSKFPSQQLRMDPSYEQSQMPFSMMENAAFKRNSYAEGRHSSYQFLQQQGMPNFETAGRQFHRGQQLYPRTGAEMDYSAHDSRAWRQGHGYHSVDQYSEPLPQDLGPPDNFNPVLNYLSSTSNIDFDQGSDKLLPAPEAPFGSSNPKRLSVGLPYACQTSPTPSNPPDQKQFFQEPKTDHKDPSVKQGLRNWRISSYLSAFDNGGDEDLPLPPPHTTDPFEEPSYPLQATASGTDLTVPKFTNTREFKIPPRASQLPNYIKSLVTESSRKTPDDIAPMATETKPLLPTPPESESSLTAEGDKTEEAEPKEPKNTVVRREESFRRKYNATVQRSSRLRSSLIFSSQLEQHVSQDSATDPDQHVEETDKNEDDCTKLPFASQVLGQRRSTAREPFEWRSYVKSATFDNSTTATSETSKDETDNKDDKHSSREKMSKDLKENSDINVSSKPSEVQPANFSPSVVQPKPSEAELPKMDQPAAPSKPFLSDPSVVDMSDPDNRLMFFKELAAKRKAAKAAAAEKSAKKALEKPPSELSSETTVKMEKPVVEEVSQNVVDSSIKKPTTLCETSSEKSATPQDAGNKVSTEACLHLDVNDKTNKQESHPKNDSNTSRSCKEEQKRDSADSETMELKNSQASVSLPVSAGSAPSHSQPPEEPKLSNPAVKECSPGHPLTKTDAKSSTDHSVTDSLAQSTDKHEIPTLDSTSKESSSLSPSLVELPSSPKSVTLESTLQTLEPLHVESSASSLPTPSEPSAVSLPSGSEFSSSLPSSSSDRTGSSQNIPVVSSTTTSSSAPHSTPLDVIASNISPEDSSCAPASSVLSPKDDKTEPKESVAPSPPESSQSANRTSQESKPSLDIETASSSDSTQVKTDSTTQSASSETPSAADSAHAETVSADTCANDSDPNTSSFQLTTKPCSAESCILKPGSEKDGSESKQNSVPQPSSVASGFSSSDIQPSSKDVTAELSVSPSLSHSSSTSLITESSLPIVPGLERSNSKPDQKETVSSQLTPAEPPSKDAPTKSASISIPTILSDFPPDTSPSKTTATQATSPSEVILTGSSTPGPAAAVPCSSPQSVSDGSLVSVKPEKTESNTSPMLSSSETGSFPKVTSADTNKSPGPTSTESSFDHSLTEHTSKVTSVPAGPKTPTESKSITSESHPSKPSVPAENSNTDNQCEVGNEPKMPDSTDEKKPGDTEATNKVNKTDPQDCHGKSSDQVREGKSSETAEITSDRAVSLSPQSKQPVPVEHSNVGIQSEVDKEPKRSDEKTPGDMEAESVCHGEQSEQASENKSSEKAEIVSDGAVPLSPQSKQPVPAENSNADIESEVGKEPKRSDSTGDKKTGDTEATSKVTKMNQQESACNGKSSDQASGNKSSEKAEIVSDGAVPLSPQSKQPVPAENSNADIQSEVGKDSTDEKKPGDTEADKVKENKSSEKTEGTSDGALPLSPQSKQSKASPSRYHSSTANVLSSSNLRDDTKLLLGQISANSQSRTEPIKESAVTDDDKEDEADKNATRGKEGGTRSLTKGQPKTTEEREKLLEKIQNMRKGRKVYSRFELAP